MIVIKVEPQKEIKNENNASVKRNNGMILSAFMIFIFPIISIFLGAFIGGSIGRAVNGPIILSRIIGGIIGGGLAGIAVKKFDKSSKADKTVEKIHWDDL